MRPLGVHTSIKNTLINSIEEAVQLQCTTFQIFLHSPRIWEIPEYEEQVIDEFKRLRKLHGLNPLVIHASYLINLISSKPKTIASSRYLLKREVLMADALGADYYVIHLKDNKDMDKDEIYAKTKEGFSKIGKLEKCKILIENTAKSKITSQIPDLIETLQKKLKVKTLAEFVLTPVIFLQPDMIYLAKMEYQSLLKRFFNLALLV